MEELAAASEADASEAEAAAMVKNAKELYRITRHLKKQTTCWPIRDHQGNLLTKESQQL